MVNESANEPPGESDAAFVSRMMAVLPAETAPGTLEACILADFDAALARRRNSLRFSAVKLAERLRDMVWPGAPVWTPASALALSLLIGLAAGAFVPSASVETDNPNQVLTVAFDKTPSLNLSGDL